MSLHSSSICDQKRCIAKKLILTIRAIILTWLQVISMEHRCDAATDNISTVDEAFADCALPTPLGPTPLWGPGSIPNNWADVYGFLKPPNSDRYWKVRMHGAFSAKISACVQPINAATTRHGSTWNSSIGAVPNHITKNMTDEFYSKNVLRHVLWAAEKASQ